MLKTSARLIPRLTSLVPGICSKLDREGFCAKTLAATTRSGSAARRGHSHRPWALSGTTLQATQSCPPSDAALLIGFSGPPEQQGSAAIFRVLMSLRSCGASVRRPVTLVETGFLVLSAGRGLLLALGGGEYGQHQGAGEGECRRVAGAGGEQAEDGRARAVSGVVGEVPQCAGLGLRQLLDQQCERRGLDHPEPGAEQHHAGEDQHLPGSHLRLAVLVNSTARARRVMPSAIVRSLRFE